MAASDVLELTEDELRNWLKVHAKLDAGSINQWCKKNGQDQSGVWNFVTGKTAAQPKLLALLGFERHTVLRKNIAVKADSQDPPSGGSDGEPQGPQS